MSISECRSGRRRRPESLRCSAARHSSIVNRQSAIVTPSTLFGWYGGGGGEVKEAACAVHGGVAAARRACVAGTRGARLRAGPLRDGLPLGRVVRLRPAQSAGPFAWARSGRQITSHRHARWMAFRVGGRAEPATPGARARATPAARSRGARPSQTPAGNGMWRHAWTLSGAELRFGRGPLRGGPYGDAPRGREGQTPHTRPCPRTPATVCFGPGQE
jgi:hypothetical protein